MDLPRNVIGRTTLFNTLRLIGGCIYYLYFPTLSLKCSAWAKRCSDWHSAVWRHKDSLSHAFNAKGIKMLAVIHSSCRVHYLSFKCRLEVALLMESPSQPQSCSNMEEITEVFTAQDVILHLQLWLTAAGHTFNIYMSCMCICIVCGAGSSLCAGDRCGQHSVAAKAAMAASRP